MKRKSAILCSRSFRVTIGGAREGATRSFTRMEVTKKGTSRTIEGSVSAGLYGMTGLPMRETGLILTDMVLVS